MEQSNRSFGAGKLFVVGIGPGSPEHRTFKAVEVISKSDVIVGYERYLDYIQDLCIDKKIYSSGMTKEVERCAVAIDYAVQGYIVCVISSGDSGIYGMAGLIFELLEKTKHDFAVEVIPGVTASSAAGASLGAPLMLDYATISLSDLLVPWETIETRLELLAKSDIVTTIYNPKSKKRVLQLAKAQEIFLNHRKKSTLVGIVTDAGLVNEKVVISCLGDLHKEEISMRSVVIIGNSTTRVHNKRLFTPRGYIDSARMTQSHFTS